MADFKPPGVGEERVSKVSRLAKIKKFFVHPATVKTSTKLLDVVHGVVKIVAKVMDLLG